VTEEAAAPRGEHEPAASWSRIAVRVVGDPGRGSLRPLIEEWSSFVDFTVIPGVFLGPRETVPAELVDFRGFEILSGKVPLPAEAGCALAHVHACRSLLEGTATWALVLEDDAEISDSDALFRRVQDVANRWTSDRPLIYSFYTRLGVRTGGWGDELLPGAHLLPISTGFTVAYLVNRAAAHLIIDSQSPVRSTADWPVRPPAVHFCLDQTGLVDHLPPEKRASTISAGSDQPRLGSRWTRLQIWTGIWWLRHRRNFAGLGDYWDRMVSKRLYYHAYMRGPGTSVPRPATPAARLAAIVWRATIPLRPAGADRLPGAARP
jgi:hypothetical protein